MLRIRRDLPSVPGRSMAYNMWLPLTLLVLAGIVQANHEHGWKVGSEYTYVVRSRTLTTLDTLSDRYTGVLVKALLTVQVKDANTLGARISHGQFANVHTDLPEGWDTPISDQHLELRDLPITGKPFEIKLNQGVIRDLIVDKNMPTWEVNLVKSIVSQLQVDTLGANAITQKKNIQVPKENEPYATFPVMEDSVGGKCEVRYDITPLPDYMVRMKPDLVPMPKLKGDGHHIDITKTKNFDRCEQRMGYHFGISGSNNWEPGSNKNGQFLSKSSTSRVIISGSLKSFVIQSSVTTSKMSMSPRLYGEQVGIVASRMNVSLVNMQAMNEHLPSPTEPESTGNLVFVYDNPFSNNEQRRNSMANQQNNWQTSDEARSLSSSEEELLKNLVNLKAGDLSSRSSSSISSSEERHFWQPKPTLEDAPQNPLLPHFIGNNGKHIGHESGSIDMVKSTKDLVFEIANELEQPSEIPVEETLEKFTVLTSLLRTMSKQKLAEAQSALDISVNELKSQDKSQAVKQNAWAVFRDAVAQAGTGPALLTIKNWIKNKEINCMDAADIVSRIPKNARTPTAEYVRAFFELATSPEVLEDKVLRIQAILSFSELVRKAQVNKRTIHNRYPVHVFGRMISKHDKTVVNEYIPYLEKELKNAIKEGNSPMIQTYIMAVGLIGHPKILSVFEPFLEGKERTTVFQRTLMIGSLGKLSEINPKLAQSVLYKVYLNTMEAHEVRCAAVFHLMKTNPPLGMLQRMAEFTNYDTSKHVNSAVKSSILSLKELKTWGDIADKANVAAKLLNPEAYSYRYSHGFISETTKKSQNMVNDLIFDYITGDNNVPSSLYLGWFNKYSEFKTPPSEAVIMISNVQRIIEILFEDDKDESAKMPTEKLADELKIIPEDSIDIEGNLMWNNKYSSRMMPFDASTLRKIPKLIGLHGMDLKNGVDVNVNKLATYEVTMSFPTETGLPFLYTLKVPVLQKLSGKGQLKMESDRSMNIKIEARPTYSMKIQGRVGFLAPFERQHFIAGIDMNFQAYLPSRLSLDVNPTKGNMKLKMLPLKGEEKAKLIHYSVVPYTSKHDILNLQPVLTDKNTRKIHGNEIERKTETLPMEKVANFFTLQKEGDKDNEAFWTSSDNIDVEKLMAFPWTQKTDQYRKADLYLNAQPGNKEALTISAAWGDLNQQPDAPTEPWTKLARSFAPSNPGSEETRKNEMLKEVSKGIKAARSSVLDIEVQIPGEVRTHSSLTIAYSESNAENRRKVLVFWKSNLPESETMTYQVCLAANEETPKKTIPSYEMARDINQKGEFDVDIRFGSTCEQGEQMNIKGEGRQSKELQKELKESVLVKDCEKQMKQGNKILRDCQIAAASIKVLDEYKFHLNTESLPLRALIAVALDRISNAEFLDTRIDTTNPKNEGKDSIDVEMKLSDLTSADFDIHTSDMDIHVKDFPINPLELVVEDLAMEDDNVEDVMEGNLENSCIIDQTRLETFDSNSYPVHLGKCWHAIMTTYPKLNPEKQGEKLRIPKDRRVSVLARETEDGHREVKILLGEHEIKLTRGGSEPEVQLDSQQLKVTQDKGFQKRNEKDEVLFEINRLADNSIAVTADEQDVKLMYDGKRILIKASDEYRNAVRGLCGNFDSEPNNDFWGPQNCVMRTPELFIASYALTNDQCEGPSKENAKLAREQCTPFPKIWQSNVVSDIDAGRENTEKFGYLQAGGQQQSAKHCTTHRTQIKEFGDKICFTTRPVVTCGEGCSPVETKNKEYQFHCMERNEASLSMKRRIEKGANPDLSQKRIDMTHSISVPLSCKA